MSASLRSPRVHALVGALLLGLWPGAVSSSPSGRCAAESVTALLGQRRSGGARAQEAARQLEALRPDAAGELFALSSGRVPDLGPLLADERKLLWALVRSWPDEEAVAALIAALPDQPTLDDRLTMLALVGEAGGRGAISAVGTLWEGLDSAQAMHPLLVRAVQHTLVQALHSDARAFEALRRLFDQSDLDLVLAEHAAAALGTVGRGRSLPLLERLLGRSKRLDGAVLEAIGCLRPFDDASAVANARSTVRRFLGSIEPELRHPAATALGTLRDDESVPDLLGLLEDRDGRVGRAADRSLRRITGLRPSGGLQAWTRWYESELDWFEREQAGVLEDLSSGDLARVVGALRVLSMHPAHGSVAAEGIRPLLRDENATTVAAACAALAKLDDVAAFEALVELLEDEREAVRAAAQGALVVLTGATVEADPEAWHSWLALE